MKKPTTGQLSIGFFGFGSLSLFSGSVISSISSLAFSLFYFSIFLSIFFLALSLSSQVKRRNQSILALVIAASSGVLFIPVSFMILIGQVSPPSSPSEITPESLNTSFQILKLYALVFALFFFSSIIGILIPNPDRPLDSKADLVSKVAGLLAILSFLLVGAGVLGGISFSSFLSLFPKAVPLLFFFVAAAGLFRLEARRGEGGAEILSLTKDQVGPKKDAHFRQSVSPPPFEEKRITSSDPIAPPSFEVGNNSPSTPPPFEAAPGSPPAPPPFEAGSNSPSMPPSFDVGSDSLSTPPLPGNEGAPSPAPMPPPSFGAEPDQPAPPPPPSSSPFRAPPPPVFNDPERTDSLLNQRENDPHSQEIEKDVSPGFSNKEEELSPFQEKLVSLQHPQEIKETTIKPGWYPDPADEKFIRYWDGTSWTNQRKEINS